MRLVRGPTCWCTRCWTRPRQGPWVTPRADRAELKGSILSHHTPAEEVAGVVDELNRPGSRWEPAFPAGPAPA